MQQNVTQKSPYIDKKKKPVFFFHAHDYDLLDMVNHMLHSDLSEADARRKFFHHLHPRGIKEMAEIKGLRIAYAMLHLMGQIDGEDGVLGASSRINALQALFDEVMCSTESVLRINTGRVLAAIMKELIRSRQDPQRQLQLAHDFQKVASGGPRIIRSYLEEYNLLEMPEEWNQIIFDDHVHDANTKGRKSATHLIMDAWIKGIRRLRVVYYNFIGQETARELIEAGQILGMHVRIGVQFSAAFRGRFVHLIWEPRGFGSALNFLNFFSRKPVMAFMEQGKEVSEYEKRQVLRVLEQFNKNHLPLINGQFHISMPEINREEFLAFVGIGQASLLHLAKFIHTKLLPLMEAALSSMAETYSDENEETQDQIHALVARMNQLDMDYILHHFLEPEYDSEKIHEECMASDILPELATLSPASLIGRLEDLHSGFKMILRLSDLNAEDVLELVYDCNGRINRLEVFSLKDYVNDNIDHIPAILELQQAINSGNIIQLKRITLGMMKKMGGDFCDGEGDHGETQLSPENQERLEKFRRILSDMDAVKKMYEIHSLGPRIGSSSTEHSLHMYGMGIAVTGTLPFRAQRQVKQKKFPCSRLPLNIAMDLRINYEHLETHRGLLNVLLSLIRQLPFFHLVGLSRTKEWVLDTNSTKMSDSGNLITLDQVNKHISNNLCLLPEDRKETKTTNLRSWRNLHSGWKNFFKVLIGFLPAFFTFFFTKEYWVLQYFGACIWFGITGLRNICQSVIGGGGIRRSSLLKWNTFVNWGRISDSLMYTGFSVPLLDLLVKQLILCRGFSITVGSHPLILFTIMALANGIYLSSHNVFRGLPRDAAIGNFFRSILSIPVAFGLNAFLFWFLNALGVQEVNVLLQGWAAVISKLASDCVAGFIEGNADRTVNIGNRILDYRKKLTQFQEIYSRLEIRFPDQEVHSLLDHPRQWFASADETTKDMIAVLIIHSLDMLYFWMYQPRARIAFTNILNEMSREERQILLKSQNVLTMNHEISQMFIDGVAGYNFSRSLAFYLARHEEYLAILHRKFG